MADERKLNGSPSINKDYYYYYYYYTYTYIHIYTHTYIYIYMQYIHCKHDNYKHTYIDYI